MRKPICPAAPDRRAWLNPAGLVLLTVAAGCSGASGGAPQPAPPQKADTTAASVRVEHPKRQTVRRPIVQPGFNIEAFEETPLYARVTGYVGKWHVDIGKAVTKDQLLAELDVPERVVEVRQKEAGVQQAKAQVKQAQAAVLAAAAQLKRAKSQYDRLDRLGQGTLDKDSIAEMHLNYKASEAGLTKAEADVGVAEAALKVAEANRDYSKTMLEYTKIKAPYDGVVTQRNVNTRDFVSPSGTGAKGKPLYVVSKVDMVRVFINVPGAEAGWIKDGDPATLVLQGAGGEVLEGKKVTRNAVALDPLARTLRTEIDLPNPDRKLLPGMYAQATITVEHRQVWTLPAAAVVTVGNQTFCYRDEGGKAVRLPLQIGLSGGGLVEVIKKQVRSSSGARWEPIDGTEEVIVSGAAELRDGQPVRRSQASK